MAVEELLAATARRESPSVAEVAGMTLERFARAGLVVKVRSTLLDEVVLFASDNAELPRDERRPVYRAADLRLLLRGRTVNV
ncbi:MAG TPA: hypothetical protein VHR17_16175 [Thermoanaerobaculia bacterium]|nr:hypothetical protein [Thermoanaerobaculia bacterium]